MLARRLSLGALVPEEKSSLYRVYGDTQTSWLWAFRIPCSKDNTTPLPNNLGQIVPAMQALPALPAMPLHNHLDVVTSKYGINGNFKEYCPSDVHRVPDWLRKLRSSVKNAESGIRWLEMRVLVQGQPAQQIDQIVHFSEVFDAPTAAQLRVAVINPPNGQPILTPPPLDLLQKLSAQVYGLILRQISYDNRKLYQGVQEDDGQGGERGDKESETRR